MIITIDGPSASGKSTAAQALAKKLGFYYLNTGLLYRAIAYLLLKRESYTQEELFNPRTDDLKRYLDTVHFSYHYSDTGKATITFESHDITPYLKDEEISRGASVISLNPRVREALHTIQHFIRDQHNIVVEGRDSGSVVFPLAEYKFFLTASLDERARRVQKMQEERGVSYTIEQALHELQERDTRDQARPHAPLRIPDDAVVIDSTDLDLNQVIQEMMKNIKQA
jgi:cytidylate kinase